MGFAPLPDIPVIILKTKTISTTSIMSFQIVTLEFHNRECYGDR